VRFTVEGDGRTFYDADLDPKKLHLATLDLRGVRTVVLRTQTGEGHDTCLEPRVLLGQLQCLNSKCLGSASGTPTASALPF
jgi:hypothetical protein